MDFWQLTTLAGLILAMFLGFSEIYQVWLQRKLVAKIVSIIEPLDVEAISTSQARAFEALQGAIVDNLAKLDFEGALIRFSQKIDTQAIIDALAASMVEQIQNAIPEMVHEAGAEAMKEKQQFIEKAREDPFGTFLGLMLSKAAEPKKPLGASPAPVEPGLRPV